MQIGDLAMLRADRSDQHYNAISIRPTPNDVVLIEDFSDLYGREIIVYISTHTGVRDWMRVDTFMRTFKTITTNKENNENN
jgi:hypothetical protein